MKYLVKKDTKLRKKQHLFESKNICLKFFFIFILNLKQKGNIKYFFLKFFSSLQSGVDRQVRLGKSRLVRRCVLTGRGRGSIRAVGSMSRTVLKDFFSMGLAPGCKKAVW
jgi:ribosomal protein S14